MNINVHILFMWQLDSSLLFLPSSNWVGFCVPGVLLRNRLTLDIFSEKKKVIMNKSYDL